MRIQTFLTTSVLFLSIAAGPVFATAEEAALAPGTTEQRINTRSEADHKWSYDVFLQGMGNQSGLGLGFETPMIFNFLGLRAAYTFDRLASSTSSGSSDLSVRFSDIQAGIKLQLNRFSTSDIYTAVLVNFNFYQPTEGKLQNGLQGQEVCYQIEWRHRTDDGWSNGAAHDFAAFIEMGASYADLRASPSYGGGQIGNGFISRLGFRRFF